MSDLPADGVQFYAGRHRHQLTDDDSLDLATALGVATVEAERYYAAEGALR